MNEPRPNGKEPCGNKNGSPAAARQQEIRKHVRDLLSDDFQVRADSVSVLEKYGEEAAQAIVSTMVTKTLPSNALPTLSQALEEIGKPSVDPLVNALSHITELQTPEEAYLLEGIIMTLGRIRDRRSIPSLLKQLDKVKRAIRRNHDTLLVDACESARVRIHGILSELGERSALNDLLSILGPGRRRVRDGIVQALARIADRRALIPLLRLSAIESDISSSATQLIRETCREILRRENLGVDDPFFKNLKPEERTALEKLAKKAKNGNGNGSGH